MATPPCPLSSPLPARMSEPTIRSLADCFGPNKIEPVLGRKDIAVKVGDPLSAARGDAQISNGHLDMCRNAVPIKLRVQVGEIGG